MPTPTEASVIGQANLTAPPFHRRVYRLVHRIPRGRVVTYGDVARAAGSPGAARAVGQAMRRNRDTRCVPCHRVVRSDGSVGGYAGGPEKKIALLREEGVEVDPVTGRVQGLERYRFRGLAG